MSQSRINNLQNTESYKNYVNDYLDNSLAALANSGQRFGINGKGVKYVEYNIHDILSNYIDNPNNVNPIMLYFDDYNNLQMSIDDIYNKERITKEITQSLRFDTVVNDEPLCDEILYVLNSFDRIHKYSFLYNDNLYFTCFIKGRLIDTEDAGLVYFQYDTSDNKLLHLIFTKNYNALNEHDDWIIVYKLDFNSRGENNSLEYKLNIYIVRKNAINNIIKQIYNISDEEYSDDFISKFYNFDNEENDLIGQQFSLFNSVFHSYDKLVEENLVDYDNLCFLNFIFNHSSDKYKYILNETTCICFEDIILNKETRDSVITFSNEIQTNDRLLGYIDNYETYEFITLVSDVNELEKSLLFAFNYEKYNKNKDDIFIYSLYNLLTILNNNSKNKNGYLYITNDYKLYSFIDDSKDIYKIYYTDNIYVNYINYKVNIKPATLYYINENNIDHVVTYKVNINYNSDYDDIINEINVHKVYSFPYINKLNNWVIDDIDTLNTSVEAKYTGIKEFYIYVDDHYNANIINVKDTSINGYFDYKQEEFNICNDYFIKYSNFDVKCKTKVPKINSDNSNSIEFFRNTLIISINDKANIINDIKDEVVKHDYQDDYKLKYVYSLWYFDEQTKEFKLYAINNGNKKYAYDPFNNISIKDYFEDIHDKYISTLLVPNNNDIPNNFDTITSFENYLLVRNKTAKEYFSAYSNVGINYKNNYNLMLEYVDNFKANGENPKYSSTKYINNISAVELTNSVYPVYEIETKFVDQTSLIDEYRENEQHNYKTFVMINVNSENKLFAEIRSEDDIAIVYQKFSYYKTTFSEVELGLVRFNNQCYNEFTFNNNIPTVDLKEVFVRNTNILNRVNVLGLENNIDSTTKIYNGYLGTSTTADKSVLHISTSDTNINVGNDTLLNTNQINKFTKYNTLSIDGFNNVEITPNNQFIINTRNVVRKYKNYLTSSDIVVGNCDNSYILCQFDNSVLYGGMPIKFVINNSFANSVFVPVYGMYVDSNSQTHYKILFNAININAIVQPVFNLDNGNYIVEYGSSNTNGNIIINIQNTNYVIMLLNNDMFSEDILTSININGNYVYNHMLNTYAYKNNNQTIVKFNFDCPECSIIKNDIQPSTENSLNHAFAQIRQRLINNPSQIIINGSDIIDDDGTAYVSSIELNKTAIYLEVGASEQLVATIYPSNAINKQIIWSLANPSNDYIYINSNGNVCTVVAQAQGQNNAVIATTVDGEYVASCYVYVGNGGYVDENSPITAIGIIYNNTNVLYNSEINLSLDGEE